MAEISSQGGVLALQKKNNFLIQKRLLLRAPMRHQFRPKLSIQACKNMYSQTELLVLREPCLAPPIQIGAILQPTSSPYPENLFRCVLFGINVLTPTQTLLYVQVHRHRILSSSSSSSSSAFVAFPCFESRFFSQRRKWKSWTQLNKPKLRAAKSTGASKTEGFSTS